MSDAYELVYHAGIPGRGEASTEAVVMPSPTPFLTMLTPAAFT